MQSPSSRYHLSSQTRNPPLSPKQEFQSRIRTFNGRPPARQTQSESEVDALSRGARRSHELQQVSTLRVRHKRREVVNTSHASRAPLSEASYNVQRSPCTNPSKSNVPDFSAEEREAWSTKSPRTALSSEVFDTPKQPLFPPPSPRLQPGPQPSKQAKQASLRRFEPLQTGTNNDERPKTSRGPQLSPSWQAPTAGDRGENELVGQEDNEDSSKGSRRSKFLEGSMNDRSVGIASSWPHNTICASEDSSADDAAASSNGTGTDSDATPRASQQSRQFGSLGEDERKPFPPIPATTKGSTLLYGDEQHRGEDSERPAGIEMKMVKQRKGLRKSISLWNFHAIADKIFGGAGSDTASEVSIESKRETRGSKRNNAAVVGTVANVDILNERKRKADVAYAQQFGMKKQKSNTGISLSYAPAPPSTIGRTTKKTTSDTPTITPRLLRRKRDSQQISETASQSGPPILRAIRKSPSKRELEKENQQLRAMLRESQSKSVSHSASRSSLHLPSMVQQNFVNGHAAMVSPGKRRRGEDIPPVPKVPDAFRPLSKLPNSESLVELGNSLAELQNQNLVEEDRPNTAKETIEEESEAELAQTEVSKSKMNGSIGTLMQTQDGFEWPDDVF